MTPKLVNYLPYVLCIAMCVDDVMCEEMGICIVLFMNKDSKCLIVKKQDSCFNCVT